MKQVHYRWVFLVFLLVGLGLYLFGGFHAPKIIMGFIISFIVVFMIVSVINGKIDYRNLAEWWDTLTPEEQEEKIRENRGGKMERRAIHKINPEEQKTSGLYKSPKKIGNFSTGNKKSSYSKIRRIR